MARRGNSQPPSYHIQQHLGVIKHGTKSWSRQVNLVSWEGNALVLDIRDWDYTQSKYGRGITLTAEEASRLRDILNAVTLPQVNALPYPAPPEEQQPSDNGFGFV